MRANLEIREVAPFVATDLLRRERAGSEQVAPSPSGRWFAAVLPDGRPVGVVGIHRTRNASRVKGLFVCRVWRGKRVGTDLVRAALGSEEPGRRVTAFSTLASRAIFEAAGFRDERVSRYGVAFMVREGE